MTFDFRNPDYSRVFAQRMDRLTQLRADPGLLAACKLWYRDNPADFIHDWGMTFDPRNADIGLPTIVPFLLFDRQREWVNEVMDCWAQRDPLITEKSRDMGVSWLAVGAGATLCLFRPGLVVGYGSRLVEYVDKVGFPKSLFYKARMFLRYVPREFKGTYDEAKHAPFMRITVPHETGGDSVMTGEGGDQIGRGDRTSIYFIDESAHLERPLLIEAAISQTTNCRIDLSSVNGMDNPFAQKRHSGKFRVFTFHWRSDPRKDEAWYEKQKRDLDPVVVAQEIDIDYSASVSGVLIPSAAVQAAVDAHIVLGIEPTGERRGALDIADEGPDLNAWCDATGILVHDVETRSGQGSDTFATIQWAFRKADEAGIRQFHYDADGMGVLARGDARVINEQREAAGIVALQVLPFRGSGGVYKPEQAISSAQPGPRHDRNERKNKDFYANAKAQAWWELRLRFIRTMRAVELVKAGHANPYDPDDLISLSSAMPNLAKLQVELSQPTYDETGTGKILINKAPENTKSPNLGDAVMIRFAPRKSGFLSYLD